MDKPKTLREYELIKEKIKQKALKILEKEFEGWKIHIS